MRENREERHFYNPYIRDNRGAYIFIIMIMLVVIVGLTFYMFYDNYEDDIYSNAPILSLTNLSNNDQVMIWEDVADLIIPSVVCIINHKTSSTSTGSGIILNDQGYIVTNNHVVENYSRIEVVLHNDIILEAQAVGLDPYTDLAVIKVDGSAVELTPAVFGNSDQLRVAQSVMAVGNPGGLEFKSSVTLGHVSSLNRLLDINNGYLVNCIQTDAAINPGNSGGALVNQYGQVIGINSAKIVAQGYEGLGFAITSVEAENIINELVQYGKVTGRATLGITGSLVSSYNSSVYGVPQGVQVASVSAELTIASGLKANDIITKIVDNPVTNVNVINKVLQKKSPGDTIELEIYRRAGVLGGGGQYMIIHVELSEL